jgi:hypothetical protein
LAWGLALSGRRTEALEVLDKLTERSPARPYLYAKVYGVLGDADEAFGYLDQAYDQHDLSMPTILTDISMKSLYSDQRYADLLQRMGLSVYEEA